MTARFFPSVETRISPMDLPVAALILAFCAAVNWIRTSFVILCSLLFLDDSPSQERGQAIRLRSPIEIPFEKKELKNPGCPVDNPRAGSNPHLRLNSYPSGLGPIT